MAPFSRSLLTGKAWTLAAQSEGPSPVGGLDGAEMQSYLFVQHKCKRRVPANVPEVARCRAQPSFDSVCQQLEGAQLLLDKNII
jgi:hypothetical protein